MSRLVVTFDAGSSTLKMAVFSLERNRIQLTDFDVSPLSVPAEASLEERNRVLARQMKAIMSLKKVKARDTLVSISGQSVFTRFVKLPAVEEAKVSQIIRYEAQQQVPFPIEDVEWDHHIIGKTPTGEVDIVLVAVKNDVIATFTQECLKTGLEVTVVDVAPLSIYNCLRHAEEEFAECTAVIDFGARAANLIISEGNDLWARTIPIGGDNITAGIAKELNMDEAAAEKLKLAAWVPGTSAGEPQDATEQQKRASTVVGSFVNRMFAELSRSIGFYRSQPGHSAIKRILLCGGSSRVRNFKEFLSDKFKVDVSWLSPLRRVAVATGINRQQLNEVSDLLASVVGLGVRAAEIGKIRVNLLPKSFARQKEVSKKKVMLVAAGWLLVASLVLMAFERKIAHGDNSGSFNRLVKSLGKAVVGIAPKGMTLSEELQKLKSALERDSEMASRIGAIQGEIQKVETKVDAIGEVQKARLYWAQFIEDLKNTKIEVAGTGRRNYIWLTYLRLSSSPVVMSEYLTAAESPASMYLPQPSESSAYVSSTKKSKKKKTGPDTRPWVVIEGYVKIPPELAGQEKEAIDRAKAFMEALEVMGQAFACQKEHRYREDKETGYLYPISPDAGDAKAYRYRWDEAKKEVVLEGFVEVKPSEGKEDSPPAEEWQVLVTFKSSKKPDWIGDDRIQKGEDVAIPCPIELVRSDGKSTARNCARTPGYLDEVDVRWLEMRTEKLARFTILARFAGEFDYPYKTEML